MNSAKLSHDPIPQFPNSLKAKPTWCLWRSEMSDKGLTKVPYRTNRVWHASSTDPRTWATFDAALAAAEENSAPASSLTVPTRSLISINA